MLIRASALTVLLALSPGAAFPQNRAQAGAAPSGAPETVTIRLSNFQFSPEHLRLLSGVPVRLRLINDSGGGHNFSAPGLFSASTYVSGFSPPADGKINVPANGIAEILIVPTRPGTYPVECTHFLHSLFGMTAVVEVIGARS